MIENGKKYLISTDDWFVAPDGQLYRSAYGKVELIEAKDAFGFNPQRPSTNWFAKVGSEDHHIIIAGCQIHYAIRTNERPIRLPDEKTGDTVEVVNRIYFAD